MKIKTINSRLSVSDQLLETDIASLAQEGIEILICNRPDGEAADQADFSTIKQAAEAVGMIAAHIPFVSKQLSQQQIDAFAMQLKTGKRIHAYCRTGKRSEEIWEASCDRISSATKNDTNKGSTENHYQVVIVGAGSGGIAVAASLLKRRPGLRIALVDPASEHFYQPGWTMVGGGVFNVETTRREMKRLIPNSTHWVKQAVEGFEPEQNRIRLTDGNHLYYNQLVVAAGLKLDWNAVEGLSDTLGKNGVTSNYLYKLAPYTWELVNSFPGGRALFTQPPMPIKCAGAPQKAVYLSADHWLKKGLLDKVDLHFYNAGGVLFGVPDYVPALSSYMEKYRANIHYQHQLVKIDGNTKKAWFSHTNEEGKAEVSEVDFDMIHVCPPQCAPDFIRSSTLADASGWMEVDPGTLRHSRYEDIWGLGDCTNTTNAKTMAAVRKQAPVVAQNICDTLDGKEASKCYDGYGSCPLTVERGKIVLAEFTYGGKVAPTFPKWINDGTKPTRLAWELKARVLPPLYWYGMLKGREWMTSCEIAY